MSQPGSSSRRLSAPAEAAPATLEDLSVILAQKITMRRMPVWEWMVLGGMLLVAAPALPGQPAAGWRGNGTGLWPDATVPREWSRIPRGAIDGLRAQAPRPSSEAAGEDVGQGDALCRAQEGQPASPDNSDVVLEYSVESEQPPGNHGSGLLSGQYVQTRQPPPTECCPRYRWDPSPAGRAVAATARGTTVPPPAELRRASRLSGRRISTPIGTGGLDRTPNMLRTTTPDLDKLTRSPRRPARREGGL
jgi:hypothetical protein